MQIDIERLSSLSMKPHVVYLTIEGKVAMLHAVCAVYANYAKLIERRFLGTRDVVGDKKLRCLCG